MAARGFHRGHPMTCRDGAWYYDDDGSRVSDSPDRPCGHCGAGNTPDGHDGCLGTLPNVMNACCGHGLPREAYVQFEDGRVLRGDAAIEHFALGVDSR